MKRAFDITLVVLFLPLLVPLLALVACLVRYKLGRPVLFRQLRPGRQARLFALVKFRSMRVVSDSASDAERLTPFGRWLRATSLDELPTLWNVLKGEMSLVGPRPLLPEYLSRYSPRQARRHEVRPGVTGWAQVNGRNALEWDRKFELDVWYVDHRSMWLDLRILWRTILRVVGRHDIAHDGEATMSPFVGGHRVAERDASARDRAVE